MTELINKYKETESKKESLLKELYILSGIVHAYKYPVRNEVLDHTIEELEMKLACQEQLLRIAQRELEAITNKMNVIKTKN
jgi:hypothetical protein